jgi:hypothetical protein
MPARNRLADRIRIAQFGLGPIGIESIKLLATKPWAELVAGVDIDPQKQRQTLAGLAGTANVPAARVYRSFEALWAETQPQVVLHTAGSKTEEAIRQIEPMAWPATGPRSPRWPTRCPESCTRRPACC